MNTSLISVYTLKSDFLRLHKAQEKAKVLGLKWDDLVNQSQSWVTLQGFIVSVHDECTIETFDKEVISFPCLASIPSMKDMYQLGQRIEVDMLDPSLWDGEYLVGEVRIAQEQKLMPKSDTTAYSFQGHSSKQETSSSLKSTPLQKALHLDEVLQRLNQETDKKWQQYAKEGNLTEAVLTIRKTHGFSPSLALEAVKHFKAQLDQEVLSDTPDRLQQMMPTFTAWFGKRKDKSGK